MTNRLELPSYKAERRSCVPVDPRKNRKITLLHAHSDRHVALSLNVSSPLWTGLPRFADAASLPTGLVVVRY